MQTIDTIDASTEACCDTDWLQLEGNGAVIACKLRVFGMQGNVQRER